MKITSPPSRQRKGNTRRYWNGAALTRQVFSMRLKTQYADKAMSHIRRLVQSGELEHVLLVFRWNYYLEDVPRAADDAVPIAGFPDALIKTVKTLEQLGLEVSVLLEVPDFGVHVPKAVALHHWRGLPEPRLSQQQHNERQQFYMPLIKAPTGRDSQCSFDRCFALFHL